MSDDDVDDVGDDVLSCHGRYYCLSPTLLSTESALGIGPAGMDAGPWKPRVPASAGWPGCTMAWGARAQKRPNGGTLAPALAPAAVLAVFTHEDEPAVDLRVVQLRNRASCVCGVGAGGAGLPCLLLLERHTRACGSTCPPEEAAPLDVVTGV